MGKKRTNNRNRAKKKASDPRYVRMSQIVGRKNPNEEGKKSSLKLLAMIMKRSNHIPTSTTTETNNKTVGLRRSVRHHSNCGTSVLHAKSSHTMPANLLKAVSRY